jgi:hypothetical protein
LTGGGGYKEDSQNFLSIIEPSAISCHPYYSLMNI